LRFDQRLDVFDIDAE